MFHWLVALDEVARNVILLLALPALLRDRHYSLHLTKVRPLNDFVFDLYAEIIHLLLISGPVRAKVP